MGEDRPRPGLLHVAELGDGEVVEFCLNRCLCLFSSLHKESDGAGRAAGGAAGVAGETLGVGLGSACSRRSGAFWTSVALGAGSFSAGSGSEEKITSGENDSAPAWRPTSAASQD